MAVSPYGALPTPPSFGYVETADINWAGTSRVYTSNLSIPCSAGVKYILDITLQGWFENNSTTNSNSVRGRVEVSVDGGATWFFGRDVFGQLDPSGGGSHRMPMFCRRTVESTPTVDEVLARGACQNEGGTISSDLRFPALAGVLIPA